MKTLWLKKVVLKKIVLATMASALFASAACSSKEGKTTPPNKPPTPPVAYGNVCNAAGLDALIVTFEGSGICNGLAGFGSCLAEDEWYDDGNHIYDVWYCEGEGDTITLCPCGDDSECSDTGSAIVCL